jgi:hypothetical protein
MGRLIKINGDCNKKHNIYVMRGILVLLTIGIFILVITCMRVYMKYQKYLWM